MYGFRVQTFHFLLVDQGLCLCHGVSEACSIDPVHSVSALLRGTKRGRNAPQPCGCCCPLCSYLPEKGLWVRVERGGTPLIAMIYCYWLGCLLLMLPEGKSIFHLSNTFCNSAPFSFPDMLLVIFFYLISHLNLLILIIFSRALTL